MCGLSKSPISQACTVVRTVLTRVRQGVSCRGSDEPGDVYCGVRPHREGSAMLTGSCHCGAVQVQVARKPRRLTSCNCSICRRHAGLWGYYKPSQVKITARRGTVDRYIWGNTCLSVCRCATCGGVTHWQPCARGVNRMGVNFRNFDPSVIERIRIRRLDGASTWKFLD